MNLESIYNLADEREAVCTNLSLTKTMVRLIRVQRRRTFEIVAATEQIILSRFIWNRRLLEYFWFTRVCGV